MTLEFNKLDTQLGALGQAAAKETVERGQKLTVAASLLSQAAADPDGLLAKVYATAGLGLDWQGAYPPPAPDTDPLDGGLDCCWPLAEPVTLVAADGSQIYPDQHAPALYYLINVGAITLCAGSGQTPHVLSQPQLYFDYEALHDEQGNLIAAAVVDAQRDQAELRMLAKLAEEYAASCPEAHPAPLVAIKDGPLLSSGHLESTPGGKPRHQQNIQACMQALDRLRACGAAVAGYVDRSLRFDVVKMLGLSRLSLEQLGRETLKASQNTLQGLLDEQLFSFLGPGQRSARFIVQSPINQTYAEHGHEIWFFYVNLSLAPDRPELARVEVPAWVARNPATLNRVHSALVQQSQIIAGDCYPYVLARADELAVVGTEEKDHLTERVVDELMRHHQLAASSRKARAKEHARGGRRRHQL